MISDDRQSLSYRKKIACKRNVIFLCKGDIFFILDRRNIEFEILRLLLLSDNVIR